RGSSAEPRPRKPRHLRQHAREVRASGTRTRDDTSGRGPETLGDQGQVCSSTSETTTGDSTHGTTCRRRHATSKARGRLLDLHLWSGTYPCAPDPDRNGNQP